jgi:predicted RNase H-like HicB family nuclease
VDYTVVIEKADDGSYSAYVPDLPGCVSCGDTQGQALDAIREAITGHIELLRESGEPVPPARSIASVVHAA